MEATVRAFSAYGRPLKMITSFRYLGQVILAVNDDWKAVVRNLSWARVVWKGMKRILSREGVELQVSSFFFKNVVQVVLILILKTRMVTPYMVRALGGFQDQVVIRLTGQILQQKPDGKCN